MRQLVCFIPSNIQMGRQNCWGAYGRHGVEDYRGKGVSLELQEDLVVNIARAILGDMSGLLGV